MHNKGEKSIIWPLLISIILITIGLSTLLGIDIWQYFWPIIIIVAGLMIMFSAIIKRNKRNIMTS